MPVTVEWDNPEKTIMRMSMIGRWTWDEAYEAQVKGDQMIYEVSISFTENKEETRDAKAREIGEGNLSEGIRRAVAVEYEIQKNH